MNHQMNQITGVKTPLVALLAAKEPFFPLRFGGDQNRAKSVKWTYIHHVARKSRCMLLLLDVWISNC